MNINDWKCDQYRWLQNGCKKFPESHPFVEKRYFVADTPEGKILGLNGLYTN